MIDTIAKVLDFHEAFGCAIGEKPGQPPYDTDALCEAAALIDRARDALRAAAQDGPCFLESRLACACEELVEQIAAHLTGDKEGLLDALVDRMYFLAGDVIAYGFHAPHPMSPEWLKSDRESRFDCAFAHVHAANMAKLHGGKALRDSTGKVIKPPGWVAADLSDLVL